MAHRIHPSCANNKGEPLLIILWANRTGKKKLTKPNLNVGIVSGQHCLLVKGGGTSVRQYVGTLRQ